MVSMGTHKRPHHPTATSWPDSGRRRSRGGSSTSRASTTTTTTSSSNSWTTWAALLLLLLLFLAFWMPQLDNTDAQVLHEISKRRREYRNSGDGGRDKESGDSRDVHEMEKKQHHSSDDAAAAAAARQRMFPSPMNKDDSEDSKEEEEEETHHSRDEEEEERNHFRDEEQEKELDSKDEDEDNEDENQSSKDENENDEKQSIDDEDEQSNHHSKDEEQSSKDNSNYKDDPQEHSKDEEQSSQDNSNSKDDSKEGRQRQMATKAMSTSLPPYIQAHCDLGEDEVWYPASSLSRQDDWRQRAPAFLVLGAKKAGTTSLWQNLRKHPQIGGGRKKEQLYFSSHRFPHWQDDEIGSRVDVTKARHDLWHAENRQYPTHELAQDQKADKILFEATPDYLLHSTYSAQAILCTIPWVKLVVTLRHPIDRLWSHYNFLSDPKYEQELPSFDEWVLSDVKRLQQFGVLPSNLDNIRAYSGTNDEQQGWQAYQRQRQWLADRPVARSLYAIQLEEWFEALRLVGKDPHDSMLIVRSEDLQSNKEAAVMNDLFDFLEVPRLESLTPEQDKQVAQEYGRRRTRRHGMRRLSRRAKNSSGAMRKKKFMVTNYTSPPMKASTRQLLEKIFAPYNERLYRLLGKEWEGVYDADKSKVQSTTPDE